MSSEVFCYCPSNSLPSSNASTTDTNCPILSENETCTCTDHKIYETHRTAVPMPELYYTEQLQKQDLFWQTTINQLCQHIKCLEEEKCSTEYTVNSVESSLLPCITYLMIQFSETKPNLDVTKLIDLPDTSNSENCMQCRLQLPNLPALEFIAIQANDLLYMDIIKAHVKEINKLQSNISNLRSQESALLKTKQLISDMLKSKKSKLVLNGELINDLLQRLETSKCLLLQQIKGEKSQADELNSQVENIMKEIADEEKRGEELIEKLNYAGANIEIASQVRERTENIDGVHVNLADELVSLNEKYCSLQKQIKDLNVELENIKSNYRKKAFTSCGLPHLNSVAKVALSNQKLNNCTCDDNIKAK